MLSVSAPDMMRLHRQAFAGDLDAARMMVKCCDRYNLGDGLKRRLARILLDGGEPFSALSYSGKGTSDVPTILRWSGRKKGGRPRLTSPVGVALFWGEREAWGYIIDVTMRAARRTTTWCRWNISSVRHCLVKMQGEEGWKMPEGGCHGVGAHVIAAALASDEEHLKYLRTPWDRAYRVNKAARETMPDDEPWRRSRLLEYLLGEVDCG